MSSDATRPGTDAAASPGGSTRGDSAAGGSTTPQGDPTATERAAQRAGVRSALQQQLSTEHGDLAPAEPLCAPDAVEVPASASLDQTLRTFGERCGFPDYYGNNLDALLDCLRDQPSLHVTLTGSETLREADPEGFERLVEVLRQARSDSDDFHFAISR